MNTQLKGSLDAAAVAINATATSHVRLFAGDYIAGPMIVLGAPDDEGNDTDCPQRAIDALVHLAS